MRITAIKQQVKNPERTSIFVDGKYSFSLSIDELLTERLKVGIEIDEAGLKALKKRSADGKLRMRALAWVTSRPHSTKEFRDYLRRKKAEPEQIDSLTEDFQKRNYLNDEHFTSWFIEQRRHKHKSSREITAELRSKGISSEMSSEQFEETENEDKQALHALIEKLKNRSRYQNRETFMRYLISKGFSYSDVKTALDSAEDQESEPEL